MTVKLELDDIQGLIARGYRDLLAASFLLLEITDPPAARRWLASTADAVVPGSIDPPEHSLHLAFTYAGLITLGLKDDALAQFPPEFAEGMVTLHRSRILGDLDQSAPKGWSWGGPTTAPVHLALLLYATEGALDPLVARHEAALAAAGLRLVKRLYTSRLDRREHFGFSDGISQPLIEGLPKTGPPANTIRAGEIILGYRNEYDGYTERPLVRPADDPGGLLPRDIGGSGAADLGRNGSYLVIRQLAQDVRGFRRFLHQATRRADGTSDEDERNWLAAKMVGRWPSGAPLVLAPDRDDPSGSLADANDFAYAASDPDGLRCPHGAHIRRAHPRDSLDPSPGSERSVTVDKRHRLLRRGREYGPPLPTDAPLDGPGTASGEDEERGLYFMCVNANIARQFEFIQHTWVNSPKFDGLYDDPDPIVAASGALGGTFTVPARPVRRRVTGVPAFVTVRGGGYFFLPGIRAIRYLASLGAT
jgi:Dyp-type peroxidase family